MQRTERKVLLLAGRWGPLLIWLFLIFLLSNQPKTSLPSYGTWDLLVKKSAHFGAYAVLALLARWAGFRPAAALALAVAYAVSDELHQLYVPGRNGHPLDVLIDGLGAVSALALLPRLPLHGSRFHFLHRWRSIQWGQRGEVDGPSPPAA